MENSIKYLFFLTIITSQISRTNTKSCVNASLIFTDPIKTKSNDDVYLILLSDNTDTRKIGDREASRSEWLFMVLLTNLDESKICGGTLIARNFVLTSAGCLTRHNVPIPKVFVSYNLHRLKQADLVCTYGFPILHPGYKIRKNKSLKDDIALIELEMPLSIPVRSLPKLATFNIYKECVLQFPNVLKSASWAVSCAVFPSSSGNAEIHFNSKRSLYEVDQKLTRIKHCTAFIDVRSQEENYICTKTNKRQTLSGRLYGDEGSPLMYGNEQIGISTASHYKVMLERCGLALWTNIYPYVKWINKVVTHSNNTCICVEDPNIGALAAEKIDNSLFSFKFP